ncbi:MAG: hypothetical protein HC912_03550 [Saprospiraceae bacterium]|nr:hypothetical protein [Saprospiraceae bacterium]
MSKSCTGRGDHTWAHEIGHALSLNHTFYGWEAIGNIDSTTYNFSLPAPENIRYPRRGYFGGTSGWDELP